MTRLLRRSGPVVLLLAVGCTPTILRTTERAEHVVSGEVARTLQHLDHTLAAVDTQIAVLGSAATVTLNRVGTTAAATPWLTLAGLTLAAASLALHARKRTG